jgi:hypothetical protein
MAPTCKPEVAALHVRHFLSHVELRRIHIVKLVRLSWAILKATLHLIYRSISIPCPKIEVFKNMYPRYGVSVIA